MRSALGRGTALLAVGLACAGATAAADRTPIGWLDTATGGMINGWALDPDTPGASIDVHLYIDGGPGCLGVPLTAVLRRPDVNRVTGYPGAHGFSYVVPAQYRDGRKHTVHAFGINTGNGINPVLPGSPKSFTLNW